MIYIKNADTIIRTWVGQQIGIGAYYLVLPTEEIAWANDPALLTDVTNGKAVVAKDDSGSNNITDVNVAINYLKGNLPQVVQTFPDGSIERRLATSVGAYSSSTLDYPVTNGKTLYLKKMSGNGALSPDIKVEIIWDATGTPIVKFVTHESISEDTLEQLVGDGVKVLRIKLTNDSGQSESVSGAWIGKEE